ncbi:MAG: MBL fold metallo-hydrolase, partial [Clostridia bacterium]
TNNFDLSAIEYCLVTHAHLDHFMPTDLFFRADGVYAHKLTKKNLTFISNQTVVDRMNKLIKVFEDESPNLGISFDIIPLYTPKQYGKYTITALRANHSYGEEAHVYIIFDGKKTILYLHDTGLLYDDVWDYLIKNNIKADFVSYDCTFVKLPSSGGHLGLDTCIVTRDKLHENGIISDKTVNCINHFSHNGILIYDELVPVAEKYGFLTAYDGMELNF